MCTDVHVHERASSFSKHASVFCRHVCTYMCEWCGSCVFVVRLEVRVCVGGFHIYVTAMVMKRTTTLHNFDVEKNGVTARRRRRVSHEIKKRQLVSAHLTPTRKKLELRKTNERGT